MHISPQASARFPGAQKENQLKQENFNFPITSLLIIYAVYASYISCS